MQFDYPIDHIECIIGGNSGTPILFLHGWGGDMNSMKVLSEPISTQRKAVSISLPGFGNSPEPSLSWGTSEYIEAVYNWIKMHGIIKIDIVSHSFGGRIAIGLAHRYPACVNRLVLVSSAGLVLPRSLKVRSKLMVGRSLNRIGKLLGENINQKLQARKQRLGSSDWLAASPVMRQILTRVISEDLSVEMRELEAKTLLLWGSDDTAVPVKIAKRMNLLIPKSKLTILQNSGHYPFLDQTGKALSEIWDWLKLPPVW